MNDKFWNVWDIAVERFLSPARVRTTVPAFLGATLTFVLNRYGVDLTGYAVDLLSEFGLSLSREAVFAFVVTGVTYVVYSVISEIEKRRPEVGLLLGRRGAPVYGVTLIHDDPLLALDDDVVDNDQFIVFDGDEDNTLDRNGDVC